VEKILEVKNLTKIFGNFTAVDNISFSIEKGEILGFLGPNGAGKTTTITMLLGLTKPTKGEINIFGLDLADNREAVLQKINFATAYSSFMGRLTVFENLYVFSQLYGIENPREKIRSLLDEFEVYKLRDSATQSLSSGELTRVSLCKALLNEPRLLLLDEPTASLDPEIANKVRDLLCTIRREKNISMLYTSHNMEEITRMCDRVIFLNHGKIVAADTPLNLTRMIEKSHLKLTFDAPLEKAKNFLKSRGLEFEIPQPNYLEIVLNEREIGEVLTQLARNGISITDINIEKPNLEDVFLKIASSKKENEDTKN